jgi:hypothetical protein
MMHYDLVRAIVRERPREDLQIKMFVSPNVWAFITIYVAGPIIVAASQMEFHIVMQSTPKVQGNGFCAFCRLTVLLKGVRYRLC